MQSQINSKYRKKLPGTNVDYFDARQAVNDIEPGAYDRLSYTARLFAENLVRKAEPENLTEYLKQLIYNKRDLDFPWYPARVVCHDILGQTALVDLAVRGPDDRRTVRRRWLVHRLLQIWTSFSLVALLIRENRIAATQSLRSQELTTVDRMASFFQEKLEPAQRLRFAKISPSAQLTRPDFL